MLCISAKGRPVKPKTIGQKEYIKSVLHNTVTIGVGPAGTGKTYLAVAAAVAAMLVVTVSAANSEAIMTYLTSLRDAAVAGEAWADSPVNTEEGTGGLCLRGVPGGAGRPHHSDCGRSGDRCNPGADRPGGIPV